MAAAYSDSSAPPATSTSAKNISASAAPYFPSKALAEAYGWKHLCAENEEELRKALHELYSGEHLLLEIKADPQKSADALTEFLSKTLI